jgi:hypothetical protein
MACPFILIHMGPTFPLHVNTCIQQILKWNPDERVVFVADEVHREKVTAPCEFVSLESVPSGVKRTAFQERCRLDSNFRGGFWKFSTERLFVLEDYLIFSGINECIHIENDNMVYFTASYMLPKLREEYVGLAAPYLGKGEMTFGILYVKNAHALSDMNIFILGLSHTGDNEMKLGCRFFLTNHDEADFLPTVSNECEIRDNDYHFATAHGSAFRGVWDAAAYGQYLGGIDERNDAGRQIGFVNETCAFRTDQFEYTWEISAGDGQGDDLKYPRAHRHGHSWPIYILHVHSKQLHEFTS